MEELVVRQMKAEDLKEVGEVDLRGFSEYYKKVGREGEYLGRDEDALLTLFTECKDGSLVLTKNHKIIGSLFCHRNGEMGFLGPLSIDKCEHGNHLSKILISKGIQYLKLNGCKTVALETMVDAPGNISLYMKNGFYNSKSVFSLVKNLDDKENNNLFNKNLSFSIQREPYSEDTERYLYEDDKLSYKDSKILFEERKKDLLVVRDEKNNIECVITGKRSEKSFEVKVLYTKRENLKEIEEIIKLLELYVLSESLTKLILWVDSDKEKLILDLFNRGYKIESNFQRMILSSRDLGVKNTFLVCLRG